MRLKTLMMAGLLACLAGGSTTALATNQCLHFDGVDDFAVVPNTLELNPGQITVEAWINADSFRGAGTNPIVDKGYTSHSDPYYQYHLSITGDAYPYSPRSGGFSVSVGGQSYGAGAPVAYTPGQWSHLAGTYDGDRVSF